MFIHRWVDENFFYGAFSGQCLVESASQANSLEVSGKSTRGLLWIYRIVDLDSPQALASFPGMWLLSLQV